MAEVVVLALDLDARSPDILAANSFCMVVMNEAAASDSATRSCGRLGPASDGSTVPRSSSSVSVKTGSGDFLARHRPCSLA